MAPVISSVFGRDLNILFHCYSEQMFTLIHEKLGFEYPAPVAKSYQWQILNLFLYTSINPVQNDFFYV